MYMCMYMDILVELYKNITVHVHAHSLNKFPETLSITRDDYVIYITQTGMYTCLYICCKFLSKNMYMHM